MNKKEIKSNFIFLALLLSISNPTAAIPIKTDKIRKSKSLVVAVIDTGLDIKNQSLEKHLWKNSGETGMDANGFDKGKNNKDDDNNGYVDDVNGWNFIDNTNNINDEHGHGTHISGLITESNENIKIMVLKYYNKTQQSTETLNYSTHAILYAIKMNADIINFSGGGFGYDENEANAIKLANEKNIIVVAASGNDSTNTDRIGFYPASYNFENIISVGALGQNYQLLKSSNYGVRTVHIAAPGENILSDLPDHQKGYMSGTSQATAIVTNRLAQLFSKKTSIQLNSIQKIKSALIDHSTYKPELKGKILSSSFID